MAAHRKALQTSRTALRAAVSRGRRQRLYISPLPHTRALSSMTSNHRSSLTCFGRSPRRGRRRLSSSVRRRRLRHLGSTCIKTRTSQTLFTRSRPSATKRPSSSTPSPPSPTIESSSRKLQRRPLRTCCGASPRWSTPLRRRYRSSTWSAASSSKMALDRRAPFRISSRRSSSTWHGHSLWWSASALTSSSSPPLTPSNASPCLRRATSHRWFTLSQLQVSARRSSSRSSPRSPSCRATSRTSVRRPSPTPSARTPTRSRGRRSSSWAWRRLLVSGSKSSNRSSSPTLSGLSPPQRAKRPTCSTRWRRRCRPYYTRLSRPTSRTCCTRSRCCVMERPLSSRLQRMRRYGS
mmetsp:Transcript_43102/g.101001  ORF Transcript_43102/g.101001 Transcript_43102/m.101001 type:complete len:350 (+) Transcript_43102:785-1834(+)